MIITPTHFLKMKSIFNHSTAEGQRHSKYLDQFTPPAALSDARLSVLCFEVKNHFSTLRLPATMIISSTIDRYEIKHSKVTEKSSRCLNRLAPKLYLTEQELPLIAGKNLDCKSTGRLSKTRPYGFPNLPFTNTYILPLCESHAKQTTSPSLKLKAGDADLP